MGGKYGKFVVALLIIGNFISIEVPLDDVKNFVSTVIETISDISRSQSHGNRKEKLERLREEAGRLYNNQNFPELLEVTDEIIKLDPNSSNAYTLRGFAYQKLNKHDKALQAYLKAIELKENDYAVYANAGEMLYELGRYPDAMAYLNRSLELGEQQGMSDENLKEILYYRKLAYMELNHENQGQSDFTNTRSKKVGYTD